MRRLILMGFLLAATGAYAQLSEPKSEQARNILDDSPSLANQLPAPQTSDLTVQGLLTDAMTALRAHHTGEAQEALEQAESLALDRSVPQSAGIVPSADPLVADISQARRALGMKDIPLALFATESALTVAKAH